MGGGNFALTCVPSLMDDPIQHQRYVITFAAFFCCYRQAGWLSVHVSCSAPEAQDDCAA